VIGTRYWEGGRGVNLDYLPSMLEESASVNRLDIATHLKFPGEEKADLFSMKLGSRNDSNTYILKEQLRCKSTIVMFSAIVLHYIGVNPK